MTLLTILDVGHGNSAVLESENYVVVIDSGPKNGLLEFLQQKGITKIDLVLLSHADQDHIGGLINLLSSDLVEISSIRLNPDASKSSQVWDDLVYELNLLQEKKSINFFPSLTFADNGLFDQGILQIQILGPSTYLAAKGVGSTDKQGRKITSNSMSAIVRIIENEEPIALFPGDIDDVGLDDLLARNEKTQTPILVFPHHGGLPGSQKITEIFTKKLTEAISPELVVFSIGRKGNYPRQEVIKFIKDIRPEVKISCTQLSMNCASVLPLQMPTYISQTFSKGAELNKCCAGTITINTSAKVIWPFYSEHQNFITANAPTAICRLTM